MIDDLREVARVRTPILLISAAAWGLLLVEPGGLAMVTPCMAIHSDARPWSASLQLQLVMHPPAALAAGWVLMLVAMMAPALIQPVHHLRVRSFTHRRARAIALFAAAYAAIWIALGSGLVALTLAVAWLVPYSYLPAATGLLIAFVWQCSPIKQRCLNRCHAHPALAAFGVSADLDALRFGATHGTWCAGSCWAWMLLPMLLPRGHLVAMAAVTVLTFSERLEQPRRPGWRVRGLGKAIRIVVAQARIRLRDRSWSPVRPI
jgi:predicted metal-binding membrane protein